MLEGNRSRQDISALWSWRNPEEELLPEIVHDTVIACTTGTLLCRERLGEDRVIMELHRLMPKIDTHHHLWDQSQRPQTWMTPELNAVIGGPFDMADWAAAAEPAGITHGVFVQTVPLSDETPEVLALSQSHPALAGVVGWIDVASPVPAGALLDALIAGPGGRRLVGVRVLAEYVDDSEWLTSDDVSTAAAALGARDLSLDLLTIPSQLPAAARLVAAHPNTRFVLDHLSKPTMRLDDFDAWARDIRTLAASPNVACKLSGFMTYDAEPMTAQRLQPWFDVAIEAFGPERLMFGSDWPVSILGGGLAASVSIAEELVAPLTLVEHDQIFFGTALRWYPGIAPRVLAPGHDEAEHDESGH